MKRLVYLDTTIPSFMFEVRDDAGSLAKRKAVETFWSRREAFQIYASVVVLAELERGRFPGREQAMGWVQDLAFLEINQEVRARALLYRAEGVMPVKETADSVHLALASYYKVDFLLSYNFKHMVNPNKWEAVQRVNAKYGFWGPAICTPEMLLGEDEP